MSILPFNKIAVSTSLSQWLRLAFLVSCATGVAFFLEPSININGLTMLYVAVVAYASYTLSRNQSLVCVILSIACLNFFFVPPRFTFHVDTSEHVLALVALGIVALLINNLVARLKHKTEIAQLNEQRARQLQTLAMQLTASKDVTDIFKLARDNFEQAFSNRVLLYVADSDQLTDSQESTTDSLLQRHKDGLLACIKEGKIIGAGTGRWDELPDCYLPIGTAQTPAAIAILGIEISDQASHEHATAMASLTIQALTRLQLSQSIQLAQAEVARQQTQSLFLAGISHDLRTPLSVVIGAASALQSQGDKLPHNERDRLLTSIVTEARYLGEITENTLQLLKLQHSKSGLHCDWESIEEIVGSVLTRMKQRDQHTRLRYQISGELPLLYVDAVLIAQLLTNLLDNALKYSDDKVVLEISLLTKNATPVMQICVKDHGPGIPKDEREHIFETYTHAHRHDQSSQRGAGLGLAVCKAIALAHRAELFVAERQSGGSNFVLRIPIPQQKVMADIHFDSAHRSSNSKENQ